VRGARGSAGGDEHLPRVITTADSSNPIKVLVTTNTCRQLWPGAVDVSLDSRPPMGAVSTDTNLLRQMVAVRQSGGRSVPVRTAWTVSSMACTEVAAPSSSSSRPACVASAWR
jgi:hypothetical protein